MMGLIGDTPREYSRKRLGLVGEFPPADLASKSYSSGIARVRARKKVGVEMSKGRECVISSASSLCGKSERNKIKEVSVDGVYGV